MDIHEFEEAAFESLVMDVRDQISALTRQLKMKYIRLLKLKMRKGMLGEQDLTDESELEALEQLPKDIELLEAELARHEDRLAKLRHG